MIDKFLFKKIEIWLIIIIIKIIILSGLLFSSILMVHTNTPERFPIIGGFATMAASLPINSYKALFSDRSQAVSVYELRFKNKDGVYFNKNFYADQIVVIPHVCSNHQKGWCLSLFDLKTHKVKKITDIGQIIRDLTKELRIDLIDFTIGSSNVIRSPRFDAYGNLFFLSNSGLFIKLGPDMQVKWANNNFNYHHTFNFAKDGSTIWAIGDSQKNCDVYPEFNFDNFINDCLVELDSITGDILSVHSITNALIDSNLHNHLFIGRVDKAIKDPLHINDVQPVNLESEYFRNGDVFVSLGHANMVVLYDTISQKIKWNTINGLFHQHDVDILDDNTIAIFNNNRVFTDKDKTFKHNEIVKYDFNEGKKTTLFENIMKNYDIRSVSQGLFEIMDSNFFVEETNFGRVVLFSRGDPVFEYYSKDKNGYSQNLGWSYIETNSLALKELRKLFN